MSVIDDIAKQLEKLKVQMKCAVNVIGKVVSGSDLEKKYVEFKAAINAVLTKDLKKCVQARGIKDKVRYVAAKHCRMIFQNMNNTHF